MPLYTRFSLTPLDSLQFQWDDNVGEYVYYAAINYFGIKGDNSETYALREQCRNDWAYLGTNNLKTYPFPATIPPNYYNHAGAGLFFCTNDTADHLYLLLFHLTGWRPVAFYINGNLVREEALNGDKTVAILANCPGPNIWEHVNVIPQSATVIKGVDCYIL